MPWTSSSPSGLFTWLKDAGQFKDGSMTPCADGDIVHTWADQKNSNDAILLGGGYTEPTYHLSLQNSLPGITFDGVGNALKLPSLFTGNKSHHVFIALKLGTLVNAYSSLFSYGVAATSGGAIFLKSTGKTAWYIPNVFGSSYYHYDPADTPPGAATYAANTAYILEAICDPAGGTGTTYQNGVLDGTLTIGGTIDGGNVNDGHILGSYSSAGSDCPVTILEELPYQGVLSDADRNIVGLYLAMKWSISTSYTSGGGQPSPPSGGAGTSIIGLGLSGIF